MADSQQVSLLEHLDRQQINCLNETAQDSLKSILTPASGSNEDPSFVLSDDDEQLLLNIPFHQTVRIRSISIKATNASQAPKKVKLFINRPSIGFEDVEDAEEPEAAQVLELTPQQVASGEHIPLRFVRFQKVNSLHVFVKSNQEDEEKTRIDAIDIFGAEVAGPRDLSALKKVEE